MKRHEREAVQLIADTLAHTGLPQRVHQGGKHLAVIVTMRDGSEHKFPISGSPRDSGCQLNQIRQQIHAWLDRVGLSSGRGAAGLRKRRRPPRVRSTIYRVEVAIDPQTGPACDPWAALAAIRPAGGA